MFRRIKSSTSPSAASDLRFFYEGKEYLAPQGITVAAALLMNNIRTTRFTPVSGEARAPFCMMGVCFECLVRIDGKQNVQACMTILQEGMSIETQRGQRLLQDAG